MYSKNSNMIKTRILREEKEQKKNIDRRFSKLIVRKGVLSMLLSNFKIGIIIIVQWSRLSDRCILFLFKNHPEIDISAWKL